MIKKQIIILSVILAVLALGILLKAGVRFLGSEGKTAATQAMQWTPSTPDRILMGRGLQAPSVELAKEGGVWKVKSLWNAQADPVKINDFLGKFWKAIRKQEFRGKGKKLFQDFGITDQDAFSVKLENSNKTLLDLRLGSKKAGDGYFIRGTDRDDVSFIDADMAGLMGIYTEFEAAKPSSAFWADLGLLNLDPEKVTQITIFRFKGDEKIMAVGLKRETDPQDPAKTSWKFLRKGMTSSPDPEKVLGFIATLTSIKAQKVVDPNEVGPGLVRLQPGLKDGSVLAKSEAEKTPVWKLVVTEGNKTTTLEAGPRNEKEGTYYVKVSSEASVFSLGASYFDDMNKDDTHFMKEAPVAEAPKKSP